nr:cobalamin-dependent protein [Candidatus Kuenenia stuttgartiensis]
MNILLIYPEFPDTFWSFKHALKFIRKKASFPPLGLLTVAAMLPSEWSKRLIDVNVTKLTDDDLLWADYAFISGMVVQRTSAKHIIGRCSKAGVKVVAGGPLFTSEHEQFENVDHFVLNEAELTLSPFLEDLNNNCAKRVYISSNFADIQKTNPSVGVSRSESIRLNEHTVLSRLSIPLRVLQRDFIIWTTYTHQNC